ncbi:MULTISPECIES: BON domain-containing protein [Burkholderia cepacia complex]|uniref:BON domain-containing protein n=1 Tax=Burkholderia cepacia complex TaxID=87882 RepID=UPI002012FDF4|nr:BON domain-containing protein [Burkholderia cenocepacia]
MTYSNSRVVLMLAALLLAPVAPALAQPSASRATVPAVDAGSDAGVAGTAAPNRDTARARRKSNRLLVKRVAAVLARTRGLDSSRILIRAADGTVTLSGTVTDNVQIPLAVNAAQQVTGVTAVRNQLRIGTQIE